MLPFTGMLWSTTPQRRIPSSEKVLKADGSLYSNVEVDGRRLTDDHGFWVYIADTDGSGGAEPIRYSLRRALLATPFTMMLTCQQVQGRLLQGKCLKMFL